MEQITDESSEKTQKHQLNNTQNDKIPMWLTNTVFFGCTLLLCIVIGINALYQTPLFLLGINFIYNYQQNQNYNLLHFVQNVFSLLCNPIGVGAVLVFYYIIVNRKLLLMVHLSYFLLAAYIMGLLKQSFQQSRPIWTSQKIQKWEWFCPRDFGNPSGHSFAVSMLYQPIISDSLGYGRFRIWGFVLLVLCIMVPLSRMYLGVHSANQILFGLALGQIFLILYKYIYQKYLYFLFWSMLMKHHKIKKLVIAVISHILAFLTPIIFYYINKKQRPFPEEFIKNLNRACGLNTTALQTQGHMLVSCAGFSFFFGIFYGFVMLMDTIGYRKYLMGLWKYESYLHMFLKIIVYLVCSVLPAGIFYLFSKHGLSSHMVIEKYTVSSLSALSFGLGLSYFAPILTFKLGIMRFSQANFSQHELKQFK